MTSATSLYINCAACTHARHMHIAAGPCQAVTIEGPRSEVDPTRADPHPGRIVTKCDCLQFAPVP
jgi:hypothetical protein